MKCILNDQQIIGILILLVPILTLLGTFLLARASIFYGLIFSYEKNKREERNQPLSMRIIFFIFRINEEKINKLIDDYNNDNLSIFENLKFLTLGFILILVATILEIIEIIFKI